MSYMFLEILHLGALVLVYSYDIWSPCCNILTWILRIASIILLWNRTFLSYPFLAVDTFLPPTAASVCHRILQKHMMWHRGNGWKRRKLLLFTQVLCWIHAKEYIIYDTIGRFILKKILYALSSVVFHCLNISFLLYHILLHFFLEICSLGCKGQVEETITAVYVERRVTTIMRQGLCQLVFFHPPSFPTWFRTCIPELLTFTGFKR